MHVFYFKNGVPLTPTSRREYDKTYSDLPDEDTALKKCISSLRSGDTLYVERESFLADTVAGAVTILKKLAKLGVDVYLGRAQKLIRSETSPYTKLSEDLIGALVGFKKAYNKFRQFEGYRKAREEGRPLARQAKPLPENFEDVKRRWLNKELPLTAAAAECKMAVTTFWKRCQD